jgi:hypothetical protein
VRRAANRQSRTKREETRNAEEGDRSAEREREAASGANSGDVFPRRARQRHVTELRRAAPKDLSELSFLKANEGELAI